MPSRPISSSSVGSVVGSCGQRISSPFHTGRCGCAPRPSEQYSKPRRCVSRSACTFICQPAAPCVSGARAEDVGVAIAGSLHLGARPCGVRGGDAVLPADVVPRMDADLESGIAGRAHHVAGAPSDVGSGQHGAVEQGLHAVVAHDRRAAHLAEKSRPEHAPDRAPGVIRAEREEERRVGAVLFQQQDEVGHALARAAQRVDVDLEGEQHRGPAPAGVYSTRLRASATCPR